MTDAKKIEVCICAHERRNHGRKRMWNGRMDKECWLCPCKKFQLDNDEGKLPAAFPGPKWFDEVDESKTCVHLSLTAIDGTTLEKMHGRFTTAQTGTFEIVPGVFVRANATLHDGHCDLDDCNSYPSRDDFRHVPNPTKVHRCNLQPGHEGMHKCVLDDIVWAD